MIPVIALPRHFGEVFGGRAPLTGPANPFCTICPHPWRFYRLELD
jgi:hypothetical protein